MRLSPVNRLAPTLLVCPTKILDNRPFYRANPPCRVVARCFPRLSYPITDIPRVESSKKKFRRTTGQPYTVNTGKRWYNCCELVYFPRFGIYVYIIFRSMKKDIRRISFIRSFVNSFILSNKKFTPLWWLNCKEKYVSLKLFVKNWIWKRFPLTRKSI